MEMADGDRFTPEQAEALRALRDGRNVFLSGNAGTGKSYVLNAFISDLKARNVDFLAQASVDGISIDRVTIEEGTGPDGKPFRYIRVAYTFENVTDSDAVAPYTDINAYQDGIKLDRSYKVQDQRAQKQIEPGGKLKSFTAFAPDSETVPVTVKVMAPGEKEPRSERCYCIVNPGLQ